MAGRELELIDKRARMKAALKAEFIRQQYNPHRFIKGEPVFDPALQRFMAMRSTQYDHFKPTRKTSLLGICQLIPFALFFYVLHTTKAKQEKLYRTGQIAYKDREYKYI